ncbi:MAG: hypothetical protein HY657_03575 [Acidobacteria bacterium]|nr:hypothetical protein [Acidobacteriota bacterium]
MTKTASIAAVLVLVVCAFNAGHAASQQGPAAPNSARAMANIDLTGYWVSYVTEDWRFRMVTAPKQDYTSVPLNPEGIRVADTWDWQKDQAAGLECKAYGAASLMRQPTRLRISWQNDNMLKVEADAGTQVRLFSFGGRPSPAARRARTWQGVSIAEWEDNASVQASGLAILRIPPPPPSYAMKVVTTALRAGYLRSNGVPYSENTVVTEYYDTLTHSNGQDWLVITTVVDDPTYLQQPFITTSHFKREADGSRRQPTPCEIAPPTRGPRPVPPDGYRANQPRF